jgi:Lon protease-like protein
VSSVELPMFPLGTVLFPGALLPLHVFEPRYQALTSHCLAGLGGAAGGGDMGIVLIERGSEVGGGDVRFGVGTRARIVSAVPLDGGRWFVVLVGVERIRVVRWLPDDPFPRAEVESIPDRGAGAGAAAHRAAVERLLRRALALKAELGEPTGAPATVDLDPTAGEAAWQAAAVAPFGPADAQRVLEADSVDERLRLLEELLADEVSVLAHRVSGR